MTNTDNFEADDAEQLDGDFDQADDAVTEDAAAPPPKKSGGAGKFVVILLVLVAGGAFGAAKLGLLPFAIPGITPPVAQQPASTATPPAVAAATTPAPAPGNAAPNAPSTPAPIGDTAGLPAALPPAISTPPADSGAPTPVTGADATVPPFGNPAEMPAGKPDIKAPAAGDKKPDNAPFLPEGLNHASGPPTIAPPADFAASAPFGSAPPSSGKPAITPPSSPLPPTDTAGMPGVPAMPAATPAPVASDPLAAPPAVPSVPATAGESEKVQELEARIAMLEKTITDLKSAMASKSDISDLRATVDRLGTRHEPSQKSPKPAVTENVMPDVSAPAASMTPAEASGDTGKAPPKTQRRRHSTATGTRPASPIAATHRWILKSATPNTAWVAQPGSSEIKAVSVGDTLSPIGKITSIGRDSSGRWVVLGSRGKINQ